MGTDYQIAVKKRNGDLHLQPRGDLDGNSAWQLINLLSKNMTVKAKFSSTPIICVRSAPLGAVPFNADSTRAGFRPANYISKVRVAAAMRLAGRKDKAEVALTAGARA